MVLLQIYCLLQNAVELHLFFISLRRCALAGYEIFFIDSLLIVVYFHVRRYEKFKIGPYMEIARLLTSKAKLRARDLLCIHLPE